MSKGLTYEEVMALLHLRDVKLKQLEKRIKAIEENRTDERVWV